MMVNYILYIIIMQMNRQWMYSSRLSGEFTTGLKDFLVVANANRQQGFIICPCVVCKNVRVTPRQEEFTWTCLCMVSCQAIIVGPSMEKEGSEWKTMKKGMISMTTIVIISVILSWRMMLKVGKG